MRMGAAPSIAPGKGEGCPASPFERRSVSRLSARCPKSAGPSLIAGIADMEMQRIAQEIESAGLIPGRHPLFFREAVEALQHFIAGAEGDDLIVKQALRPGEIAAPHAIGKSIEPCEKILPQGISALTAVQMFGSVCRGH